MDEVQVGEKGALSCDTAFAFSLELVKNPGILEGTLAELSGFVSSVS